MNVAKASLIAALAILIVPSAMAEPAAKPDVATLLFSNPQWGSAPTGSTITYAYSKKTSEAGLGPAFDDRIKLTLEKGDDAERRTVDMKMFSGTNAKAAGPFYSSAQNPVLLIFMENNVQELAAYFKANPLHLKNAIRKAWRDEAKIEDATIDVDGKPTAGTRITVTPYAHDEDKDKMMGLDGLVYTIEFADSVPGEIAAIDIRTPGDGKPSFSETLRYQSEAKP